MADATPPDLIASLDFMLWIEQDLVGGISPLLGVSPVPGMFAEDFTLTASVQPVPVPAALPMMMAGIAALGMVARRRG
jgi:hypothetical protein